MFAGDKTVHIHVSQLCNFKCLHCYSVSGPGKHAHLPTDRLLTSTRQLFDLGYRRAALSGGEPTLHPDFAALCHGLRDQGFSVSVISNGWQARHLAELLDQGVIDTVGLSFDGLQPLHDRIRAKPGSFQKATDSLRALRGAGSRNGAGAVVSVTHASLADLPDLADHLARAGAGWIQFHPIAAVGRARNTPGLTELPQEALIRLILLTGLMRSLHPDVQFHCDAVLGPQLDRVSDDPGLISPLVIDSDGTLLPYVHGMPRQWQLGTLNDPLQVPVAGPELRTLVADCLAYCRGLVATSFYQELSRMAEERQALAG